MCPVGSTGGEYGVRIVTGNDLKTGDVIWWTGQGWSRHLAKAVDAGNQAEAILAREDAERRVNAGYIIEAEMTEDGPRSEEHTSELQSLMRISYAVFCLKKKNTQHPHTPKPSHPNPPPTPTTPHTTPESTHH